MKRLVVASTNPGKTREVAVALANLGDWDVSALPPGIPDIEETEATFLDNAVLKALHYSRHVEELVVADDSGLSVDALGGRPGIHSARYGATAEARNAKLLAELRDRGAQAPSERTATFYCALALAQAGQVVWTVRSELHGHIPLEPRGGLGFGYDPIFFVPELGRTLAELTTTEKNQVSARGQALSALRGFLFGTIGESGVR